MEGKAALRRAVISELQRIGEVERSARSALVLSRLAAEEVWRTATAVLAFYPFAGEVALLPLLAQAAEGGRSLWLPRIEGGELAFRRVRSLERGLVRHPYGMLEPDPDAERFDPARAGGTVLVVTPGVAFDRDLNRLGRGRGYYDRFLRLTRHAARPGVEAVAVAFDVQLVSEVPHGPDDERVDAIVTEHEVLRAPRP